MDELAIFTLDTLEAMKRDAMSVAGDASYEDAQRVTAFVVIHDINRELDRRIDWVAQVRYYLELGGEG